MSKKNYQLLLLFLLPASAMNLHAGTGGTPDTGVDYDMSAYASLRMAGEYVWLDHQPIAVRDDSYFGLRDAYSRFGVKGHLNFRNGFKLSGKLEAPVNLPRFRAEDPTGFEGFYKDNNSFRVYKLALSSEQYGYLTFGKQWLAYYNNVAYPVDYFSTFYSGYATHATFRREALTYQTPSISGFKATVSGVDLTDELGTDYLDTMQYALSWGNDAVTVAVAYQDSGDVNNTPRADLLGASASYTTGPWRVAAKVEQLQSERTVKKNKDPVIWNIYGSYTKDKYTFKAMYGHGDGKAGTNDEPSAFFIGDTVHLGVDYQHSDNFKLFAEYFYESNSNAVYKPNSKGAFAPYGGFQNKVDAHAISIGVRLDV